MATEVTLVTVTTEPAKGGHRYIQILVNMVLCMCMSVHAYACVWMQKKHAYVLQDKELITILLMLSKTWEKSKCSSKIEWVKKMWSI